VWLVHFKSRFVRWISWMVLSLSSLSMLVYSFKHLPGATAAQGLGDGRPEMSESMPVFELYTSSACVAKPGFMT
jgi:hypothetical protein